MRDAVAVLAGALAFSSVFSGVVLAQNSILGPATTYRALEANGYRHVQTKGAGGYVTYHYARGPNDQRYFCVQEGFGTGPCYKENLRVKTAR
jgi:hypothetical protein